MFGLEKQKKKKTDEFVFELEKELKAFQSHQNYKKRIDEKIQDIRSILRKGDNKDEFDKFGVLLHGYTALLKVMSRLSPK